MHKTYLKKRLIINKIICLCMNSNLVDIGFLFFPKSNFTKSFQIIA
jgi:hypothetical protein